MAEKAINSGNRLLNLVSLHFVHEPLLDRETFGEMARVVAEDDNKAYNALSVEDKVAHQGRISLCGSD